VLNRTREKLVRHSCQSQITEAFADQASSSRLPWHAIGRSLLLFVLMIAMFGAYLWIAQEFNWISDSL
jgi:hypothetical protein